MTAEGKDRKELEQGVEQQLRDEVDPVQNVEWKGQEGAPEDKVGRGRDLGERAEGALVREAVGDVAGLAIKAHRNLDEGWGSSQGVSNGNWKKLRKN